MLPAMSLTIGAQRAIVAPRLDHKRNRNYRGLVRLVGGSRDDFGDYTPADAGEPPMGAKW